MITKIRKKYDYSSLKVWCCGTWDGTVPDWSSDRKPCCTNAYEDPSNGKNLAIIGEACWHKLKEHLTNEVEMLLASSVKNKSIAYLGGIIVE